jgi:hypothetical protein
MALVGVWIGAAVDRETLWERSTIDFVSFPDAMFEVIGTVPFSVEISHISGCWQADFLF